MLTYQLLHPEILRALASAGHGSRVLVADGNYPFSTGSAPGACRVYLNLAPGLLDVVSVVAVLAAAVPVEQATSMATPDGVEPPVLRDLRRVLPAGTPMNALERFAFYDAARGPDVALVVATGEQRVYANLLLTIGVRA